MDARMLENHHAKVADFQHKERVVVRQKAVMGGDIMTYCGVDCNSCYHNKFY